MDFVYDFLYGDIEVFCYSWNIIFGGHNPPFILSWGVQFVYSQYVFIFEEPLIEQLLVSSIWCLHCFLGDALYCNYSNFVNCLVLEAKYVLIAGIG